MKVGLIGLHQVRLSLIVKKRVLENVMLALNAPITCGLMTKGVEPKPAATKQFLFRVKSKVVNSIVVQLSILSFAKK